MPKWKSVLHEEGVKSTETGSRREGIVAWVPMNDAAKAHKTVEKAIQLGAYTPKDPNERQNVAEKLKIEMNKDLRRRGLLAVETR